MCLTVPMRIEEIVGPQARCSALGEERWGNLMLLGDDLPKVGDYVSIHLGFVQRVVPEAQALEAQELFRSIVTSLDGDDPAQS